jgi:hypothetical protein
MKEKSDNRSKIESDPLLALVGSGKDLWADEHADEYVRRLREDSRTLRHRRSIKMLSRVLPVNAGDRVRVIGIPSDLPDDPRLKTCEIFQRCLGHTFTVMGIDEIAGLPNPLVRLDVGEVTGQESFMETIWIEPEYLEKVD